MLPSFFGLQQSKTELKSWQCFRSYWLVYFPEKDWFLEFTGNSVVNQFCSIPPKMKTSVFSSYGSKTRKTGCILISQIFHSKTKIAFKTSKVFLKSLNFPKINLSFLTVFHIWLYQPYLTIYKIPEIVQSLRKSGFNNSYKAVTNEDAWN